MSDSNAKFQSLEVNSKGEALLTYRRADGWLRRVLVWGGQRGHPGRSTRRCASGRTTPAAGASTGRRVLEDVQEPLRAVRRAGARRTRRGLQGAGRHLLGGPVVAATRRCSASIPGCPSSTDFELHLSHWTASSPKLEVYTHWTYGGQWQGVFGRYTYLGQPIFGFGSTAEGNPKDRYGRNVYIDTLNSAYGPGWKRESGILVHKPTGTFCHSFVPQKPFPGYPSQAMRPPHPASGTASP